MKRNIFNLLALAIVVLSFTSLTSCSKEESQSSDIEQFVSQVEEDTQTQTRSGRGRCFELVWPITIAFPDSTEITVDSVQALREAAKSWKEANPDTKGRIKIAFPIEVITKDGEMITVSSREELRALKRDCKDRPFKGHKKPCFRLVYPISVTFPDGQIISYDSRQAVKKALRSWKKENPDSDERPMLQFPVVVKLKDGTEVTVNSKEELKQLKEDCK